MCRWAMSSPHPGSCQPKKSCHMNMTPGQQPLGSPYHREKINLMKMSWDQHQKWWNHHHSLSIPGAMSSPHLYTKFETLALSRVNWAWSERVNLQSTDDTAEKKTKTLVSYLALRNMHLLSLLLSGRAHTIAAHII